MALVEAQIGVAYISGSGSTALEIHRATQRRSKFGELPRTKLARIITSAPEKMSKALLDEFPQEDIVVVRPQDFTNSLVYGEALIEKTREVSPHIVGQWGHTPLTPENVIWDLKERDDVNMINQHPGPIDPSSYDFGGRGMSSADRVHTARLLFVRETKRNFWTDVTAQRVSPHFDQGRVLKRGRVPILPEDTVESLKARAKDEEYRVQIATVHDFEEGTVEQQPLYDDLVLPHEIQALRQAKRAAMLLNPPEK